MSGMTISRTRSESGAFVVLTGEVAVIGGDVVVMFDGGCIVAVIATVGSVGVRFVLIRPDASSTARVLLV